MARTPEGKFQDKLKAELEEMFPGCFITKLSEGDFDRENDGKRKISVEISYDRATVENNYETI